MTTTTIPCPFVYNNGKRCNGHVVRVEAFKADLEWKLLENGEWYFSVGSPRSHYHVYCSEKDNHAGYSGPDSDQMKFYFDQLPEALSNAMAAAEDRPKPKTVTVKHEQASPEQQTVRVVTEDVER